LLTQVYGLDKDRLYVTYFGGDKSLGLGSDEEAKQLWMSLGLAENRILPFGCKENFWEMGDQGPCGPCSEIHYDLIGNRFVPELVNYDDPTLIEIWNLVFMQFNREEDRSLRPLPSKHVDTGMGFERMVCALQGKLSNYDTDVFSPIFAKIQEVSGARPYQGLLGSDDHDGVDMAYRVVADHVRTLAIAITDGGVPSNEGRGYVLRRILRRGARYARSGFGVTIGTFFSTIVDAVFPTLSGIYPELLQKIDAIKMILNEEEAAFAKTLDRGIKLFDGIVSKGASQKVISGSDAWRLYDTFGFPIDLTKLMAEEKGMHVDDKTFEEEQAKAKELSKRRKDRTGGKVVKLDVHALKEAERNGIPATDDKFKYTHATIESKVLGIFHPFQDGKTENFWVQSISESETVGVLLNRTNLYGESGGQEYDTGSLAEDGVCEFQVEDVQVFGGYVLHIGSLKFGSLSVNQNVLCAYDGIRRRSLQNNHTATHVVNYALREVLGDGIDQKGSLVSQTKFRFDFSCKEALNQQQIESVENICISVVGKDLKVFAKDVSLASAKSINGLRAVFGEVYPDPVRVVSIGASVDDLIADSSNSKWMKYSIELCGGTHATSTKELTDFAIIEETSISKGVRRLVAVTGHEAIFCRDEGLSFMKYLSELQTLEGNSLGEAVKKVTKQLEEKSLSYLAKVNARKTISEMKKRFDEWDKAQKANLAALASESVKGYFSDAASANYLVRVLDVGGNTKALSSALNVVKGIPGKAALLLAVDGEKVTFHAYVDKSLTSQLNALEWADVVSQKVGGKKGGREESAQGSGSDVQKVDEAVRLALDFAKLKLA
jgi:alanyl-tRNA synthetase